ncbi:Competence protein CoiA-like family, contains a predicted nuclease domain [Terribacillus aidingensis]|uniref:Competence protein CoiA-like family, contains a predicted nuclease domain n=1 Tax=Terribacillus aidingensis TaxID=586416 RepID=A0A285NXX0_9BACI|nr:competence protein CoiA family protein [Terribacillus aidingensis]SNZ14289.1 Competence protein CoiA-like family, contains a predicted nuclease domain [Terribacillus aidingensis]
MLQAQLEDGRMIMLAAYRKEQIQCFRHAHFFCPVCRRPVKIRAGKKIIPHFAHVHIQDCEMERKGEGFYHLRGKLQLYHWLKMQGYTVNVEERIANAHRRPDLLVHAKDGKKIAIEYQCASISDDELMSRNEVYQQRGIKAVWILGGNRLKRTSTYLLHLPKREQRFLMKQKPNLPLQMLYYCADAQAFCNVQHILLTGKKQTVGQFYYRSLQQTKFPQLFQPLPKYQQAIDLAWERLQSRTTAKPLTYAPRSVKQWIMQIYEKGYFLQDIPVSILLPVEAQYSLSVPPFIWQTDLWLNQLHPAVVGENITLAQLLYTCRRWETAIKPFAVHTTKHPVETYMEKLCQAGLFEQNQDGSYLKKKASPF